MRILIVHNPSAGPDEVDLQPLQAALAQAGHETRTESKTPEAIRGAIRLAPDAVIAAGGDGTVAAVARQLIGTGIPIVPMPLGTANNIATFLGASPHPMRALAAGRLVPFDAGVCTLGSEDQLFFEAAGLGPFPQVIDLDPVDSELPRAEQLRHASQVLTDVAAAAPAYPCRLELDGRLLEGALLMVEIMNIGMIGPGLLLANDADPADGLLEVVVVRESERAALIAYLAERQRRPGTPAPFDSQRVRRARLTTLEPAPLHVDDRAIACARPLDALFSARRHAVSFLVESP